MQLQVDILKEDVFILELNITETHWKLFEMVLSKGIFMKT